MTDSAALFRAANLRIMDYPFDAALASALSVCDEAVVIVGQSEDDTLEWVCSLGRKYPGRVKIAETRFVYDRGWQERWWKQAGNTTTADWLFYHDADECIHEHDAPIIRALMGEERIGLIRFDWHHLYATCHYEKVQHIARRNARIGRRSRGWQMENWCTDENPHWPACQMVYQGMEAHYQYQGSDIADAGYLYHYGHCRRPEALAISQAKHRAWYANGDGLVDGRIPAVKPWDFELVQNLADGIVIPYDGQHPAVIHEWLKAHEAGWAELELQCTY